jgi:hypothetical protein
MSTNYESNFSNDDTFDKPALDASVNEGSLLESLKDALAADVENEDLVLRVPARPILKVIYSTFIDGDLFQLWQRRATIKGTQQMDMMRLATTIIANQLKGIQVFDKKSNEWREVHTADGAGLSFQTQELKDMLLGGASYSSGSQLARKLYGVDGHLLNAATEIAEAAGYGDDMNGDDFSENPTLG